jgi:hypothetical protein
MIEQFLTAVWRPTGYGEIRVIDPRLPAGDPAKVRQRFFDLSEGGLTTVVQHVTTVAEEGGRDIYFGVLPRMRRSGKNADVMPLTDVLWADLDAKHATGGKSGVWANVGRSPVSPSIIVDSGNGYHAYWLLRDLVPFEDASLAMKSIAKRIGGDHTYDAARVLRVPGTTNYKNGEDLHAVRVIAFNPKRRYRWADFEVDAEREQKAVRREVRAPVDGGALPDWLEDLIAKGAPQGQRSEAAFKVCVWLLRFGYSDNDIFAVFEHNPAGIGAKYHERKDGERWLTVTIRSARERA